MGMLGKVEEVWRKKQSFYRRINVSGTCILQMVLLLAHLINHQV